MKCEATFLEICFVKLSDKLLASIFGFSEFISALALLLVVYTIADERFRFRVAIAPPPLHRLTYILIGVIGGAVLLTDIWVAERWLVPMSLLSQSAWRGILGAYFLLLPMTWLYYAYIRPPVFSKNNYKKFTKELYQRILKGSDTELPVIASELARSARTLVNLSRTIRRTRRNDTEGQHKPDASDYAHDLILLLANRKLCRHIVASSPVTAIAFFEEMTLNKKYAIPIGAFASNVSSEAILNKDSIVYHEDDGYTSGLMGYRKDFSQAVYGNFCLVEALASDGRSPLDIPYEIQNSWNAEQWKVYGQAVLITLKDYLEGDYWGQHSYALYRSLGRFEHSCIDLYKLGIDRDFYSSDISRRLHTVVRFVHDAIDLIGQQDPLPSTSFRVREIKSVSPDLYDLVAKVMFEIIFSAAAVKGSADNCWRIHYNAVWDQFFGLSGGGKAWRIIHHKLRRLLYDEIVRLKTLPNYKSSRILGYCLNVLGLIVRREGFSQEQFALQKVVLAWTKKNYLKLNQVHPDVAKSCLIGSISFDSEGSRIVKTFMQGLELEPPKEYLDLTPITQ